MLHPLKRQGRLWALRTRWDWRLSGIWRESALALSSQPMLCHRGLELAVHFPLGQGQVALDPSHGGWKRDARKGFFLECIELGLGLNEPDLILRQAQPGHCFLKMLAGGVSLSPLGMEVAQCDEAMRNARSVANLSTDAKRLVEVLEYLVRRTNLPLDAGQGLVGS